MDEQIRFFTEECDSLQVNISSLIKNVYQSRPILHHDLYKYCIKN